MKDLLTNTGRPDFAASLYDATLDRAWTYDQAGRLAVAYTGLEAHAQWGTATGPYARGYDYDAYGNLWKQYGWGGPTRNGADNYEYAPNVKNQNPAFSYDAAGNLTNDGAQSYTYDAQGQQATASGNGLAMSYDGDGLRVKKVENGVTTYYLRSSVLGQQTVAEINAAGQWQKGYVYVGGQLLAMQDVAQNRVLWTHQEPYSKAQRVTDATGAIVSGVEVEPFGLETNRSFDYNSVNNKRKYTTYDRDANGGDEAHFRRYAPKLNRFAQPDPYDGSMSLQNPQSLNRYAYTNGDPVNFTDPTGLLMQLCFDIIRTDYADGREIGSYVVGHFCITVGGSGGGPGGGEPGGGGPGGNSDPGPEEKSDCEKFADMVNQIAKEVFDSEGSVQNFMDRLATTFTEFPSANLLTLRRVNRREEAGNSNYQVFGSSGFNGSLYEEGGNQVRHAVGGLIAGYVGLPLNDPSGRGNGMNDRENRNDPIHGIPDINLNNLTVPVGHRLYAQDNRSIAVAKGLGEWIRNRLCAPSSLPDG